MLALASGTGRPRPSIPYPLAFAALLLLSSCFSGTPADIVYGPVAVADEARRAAGLGPAVTTFEGNVTPPPADAHLVCVEYESQGHFVPARDTNLAHTRGRDYCDLLADRTSTDDFWLRGEQVPSTVCLSFFAGSPEEYGKGDLMLNRAIADVDEVTAVHPLHRLCLTGVPFPGEVRLKDVTCSEFGCDAAEIVSVPPGVSKIHPAPPEERGISLIEPMGVLIAGGALWVSTPNRVFRVDKEHLTAVVVWQRRTSVAQTMADLATNAGRVWVPDELNDMVVEIDAHTGQEIGGIPVTDPLRVLSSDGVPWVLRLTRRIFLRVGISRIDRATSRVTIPIELPCVGVVFTECLAHLDSGQSVAVGDGSVWIADLRSSVVRLDPDSGSVVAEIPIPGAASIVLAEGVVWVANPDETLFRIDPRTNLVIATVRGVPSNGEAAAKKGPVLVIGRDGVWVVGSHRASKVSTGNNHIVATIPTSGSGLVLDAAVGGSALWVLQGLGQGAGWIYELDTAGLVN